MPSPQFLENIAKVMSKGASHQVGTFLRESGETLEALSKKAIQNGGRLQGAEDAQLRTLYADYLRISLADRRAANWFGSTEAKATAEIRDDFFNGVLGHLGKTNDERALLRVSLARKAFEPTGQEVTLLNGAGKVSKADYQNLRTVSKSESEFFDDGMKAKWKLVNDNETAINAKLLADAKREARTDGATASAKEATKNRAAEVQREAVAQRERDAAAAAEKLKSEQAATQKTLALRGNSLDEIDRAIASGDPEKITASFAALRKHLGENEPKSLVDSVRNGPSLTPDEILHELRAGNAVSRKEVMDLEQHLANNAGQRALAAKAGEINDSISDAGNNIIRAAENGNPLSINTFFGDLAKLMRNPAVNRIVDTVADAGRHAELASYEDIAKAIARGEKVTKKEFEDLTKFFDKKLDAVQVREALSSSQQGGYNVAAGGGWGAVLKGLETAQSAIKKALPAPEKAPSRNTLAEWSSPTRSAPDYVGGVINNAKDRPKAYAALGVGLTVSALALTGWVSPEEAPWITAAPTQLAYVNALFAPEAVKHEDEMTVIQYQRYMAGSGMDDKFKQATKKFAGVDLSKDVTSDTPNELDPEKLYQVSVGLKRGSGVFNVRDYRAYLLAVASKSGLAFGEKENSQDIVERLVKHNEAASISYTSGKLLAQDGTNPEFIAKTKKFVGIDLVDSKTNKVSELDPEQMYKISVALQTRGVGSFNNREISGYIQALAAKSLVSKDVLDKAAKDAPDEKSNGELLARVVDKARDNYALSVTNRLIGINGSDNNFRDDYFKKYLGVSTLPADPIALNKAVALKYSASLGTSDLTQPVIKKYLMVAGGFKEEDLSPTGIIEALKKRQTQEGERIQAAAETGRQEALDGVISDRNRMRSNATDITRPRQAEPEPQAQPKSSRSRESVSGMFNKMAGDDDFPELKGKSATILSIYDKSPDAQRFEEELKRQVPQIPSSTAKALREIGYDR